MPFLQNADCILNERTENLELRDREGTFWTLGSSSSLSKKIGGEVSRVI